MPGEWLSLFWHTLLLGLAGRLRHPHEAVRLESHVHSVELHYHVLGGNLIQRVMADEGRKSALKPSTHAGQDLMAWLDREQIHLPKSVNRYANVTLNRDLYFWLAAYLALDRPLEGAEHLQTGVRHLLGGVATSARILQHFPGLTARYERLCAAELAQRQNALPKLGVASTRVHQLEAAIRFSLGSGQPPDDGWLHEATTQAQKGLVIAPSARWRDHPTPFLPVPLWGRPTDQVSGLRLRWLKRQTRRTARGRQKSLSSPRFDPRHEPHLRRDESTQDEYLYKEWDYQHRAYRMDWCKVNEQAPKDETTRRLGFDPDIGIIARQVRRQFEALRQVSSWNRNLDDGEDVDIDACVDAFADKRGFGLSTSALYRSRNSRSRDLSVAILIDASRSTQAWVGEHRVIEIARQSMAALAEALSAIGDDFALYGFSSDSRLRVRCDCIKAFSERYSERSQRNLLALTPADYTRMGAAIRHVGTKLQQRKCRQKLLLVLTDGRPHDPTDRYEGKYAVEDTRRALHELRAQGIHGFGLTIDQHGRDYLPDIFAPGHYAVFSRPQSLPQVLPRLYARITALAE